MDIDKMSGLAIPPEIESTANAVKGLLAASSAFDQNEIMRAAPRFGDRAVLHAAVDGRVAYAHDP